MDRYELKQEQIKAEAEYHKENTCECSNIELRKRTIKNGTIQYVYQCLNCGSAESKAIKKIEAEEVFSSHLTTTYLKVGVQNIKMAKI